MKYVPLEWIASTPMNELMLYFEGLSPNERLVVQRSIDIEVARVQVLRKQFEESLKYKVDLSEDRKPLDIAYLSTISSEVKFSCCLEILKYLSEKWYAEIMTVST